MPAKSGKISCATIVEHDSGILLVSETFRKKKFTMNLPGGSIEGEESLTECAVRETCEETGLVVRPEYLVGVYQNPRTRAGNNLTRFVFAATMAGGIMTQSDRHPLVSFYTKPELVELQSRDWLVGQGTFQAIRDYYSGARHELSLITTLT